MKNILYLFALLALFFAAFCLSAATATASQKQDPNEFTLKVDVNLVVVHANVFNKKGFRVTDLEAQHFKVFEDEVEQKLSRFGQDDIPVTVGILLDNSGSMIGNRAMMKASALVFVETSNPLDEVFVVNFNDDYYLDLEEKNFTSDKEELKEAMGRTETRGRTALYDAIRASLRHSKRGTRQKKALLVVSDGADNASKASFATVLGEAQQAELAIYVVALPCTETGRLCRRAKREMKKLTETTGGTVYFAKSMEEIRELCEKAARDIRAQYVLGYYPTNKERDGGFRAIRLEVKAPKNYGKLIPKYRPGYFADVK